jgi:hypothetical protein
LRFTIQKQHRLEDETLSCRLLIGHAARSRAQFELFSLSIFGRSIRRGR